MQKILSQRDWMSRFKNGGFDEAVKEICRRHNIVCEKIERVFCKENALFKVGDKIVKIYNPLVLSEQKQIAEVEGYKRANRLNLPVPQILHTGTIEGEDNCYYMIMDYISGTDLEHVKLSQQQLTELYQMIKNFLNAYNTAPTKRDLKRLRTDCDKLRFDLVSKGLAADLKRFYSELNFDDVCYVHADLHKGNILLDEKNQFKIIDFGDAKIAPKCCEMAPIIAELYEFDSRLIKSTFNMPIAKIKNELLKGFVLNDFGVDCIQSMCKFLNYGSVKKIKNIDELKKLIDEAIKKGEVEIDQNGE